jgi:hypothetical protein
MLFEFSEKPSPLIVIYCPPILPKAGVTLFIEGRLAY